MLANKSKEARIEGYSKIFFQLGLVLALLVVYLSIEWKSFDRYVSELNMVNLSWAPKKVEITEATFNGQNELPNYTTHDKEIEYVDGDIISELEYINSQID